MKIKKTKKSKKQRGTTTHGWGARKKHKGSGSKGGKGMAGTGKRAGHKKTKITVMYGHGYFGKQGITSKSTAKKKNPVINLRDIERNPGKFKVENGWLDLTGYKVLGDGELTKEIKIKALDISKSAREKVENAGGIISIVKRKEDKKEKIIQQ